MSSQLIELRKNSSTFVSSKNSRNKAAKSAEVVSYSFKQRAEEAAYNKALREVLKKARELNW